MLPVKYVVPCSSERGWTVESYISKDYNRVLRRIFCKAAWDKHIVNFCENQQWPFVPQVFSDEKFRYKTFHSTRIPYTGTLQIFGIKNSSYSFLQKKIIHADCCKSKIVRTPFLDTQILLHVNHNQYTLT